MLLGALLLTPAAAPAAEAPTIDQLAEIAELEAAPRFIASIAQDGLATLGDPSRERLDRIAEMRDIFYRSFAVEMIARRVLGRRWHTATDEERRLFIDALGGFVAEAVVDNLADGRFEIFAATELGTGEDGVDLIAVHTVLIEETYSSPVVWTIGRVDGELKIIDLTISGQSFLLEQKDNFARILQRNDDSIGALIEEITPISLN